ncbi:hypothetical protein HETIRDRAFT_330672 [Heterobasidion irregulare TC 32-1]|uniref:Uncharacterized protein n=1 Tax=Heterobasidion irregulare (strain TC 32-1) TaxID=747525 RepID=W4JQD1_HETIT|nr:uncharacterized protein HETIRDRAFT_330672 [Heterobasidion irregulare TC 32-1]ETW75091.1 hypothetical protein HETIRDRAFT_330672 [Heterobasidion irregulare TC 32-1]
MSGYPFSVLNSGAVYEGGSAVDALMPADIFVCSSMRDIDFVTRWYDKTPRVVVARYIFDCIRAQCRLTADNYSVGVDNHGHIRVANALMVIAPTQSISHAPTHKAIAPQPPLPAIRFVDLRAKLRASNTNHKSLPTPPQSRNVSLNSNQVLSSDGNDVGGKRGHSDATQQYGFSLILTFLLVYKSTVSDVTVKRARQK